MLLSRKPPLGRAPAPGDKLGPYLIHSRIARGGMATVYHASFAGRSEPGSQVAIKCIRDDLAQDADVLALFVQEAYITARLTHPNVPRVIDFDEDRGVYYLVMELLRGRPLSTIHRRLRRRRSKLPLASLASLVSRVVSEAAEALHAAHELRDEHGAALGVIHGDVSPENLLVTVDGFVKLLDFGVAHSLATPALSPSTWLFGKLSYLAPEVLLGADPDRRSDLWGLGAVAWELLVGRPLFSRESEEETARAVTREAIPSPSSLCSEIPPELSSIVLKALHRDPQRRFQGGRELARELVQFLVRHRTPMTPAQISSWVKWLFAERPVRALGTEPGRVRETPPLVGRLPDGPRKPRDPEAAVPGPLGRAGARPARFPGLRFKGSPKS